MSRFRCDAAVPSSTGFGSSPCINPAKVERDGRHYCGIHDPIALEKRRREREERERPHRESARARFVRRHAERNFCAGVEWQDGATLRDVLGALAGDLSMTEARALLAKFTVEE